MAPDAHSNFAVSTVATAPSPATSGTSLSVASGEGARFPAVPFNATVRPANAPPDPSNAEIIRVTARSTDSFGTIVRAQEGSSARSIQVGDHISATVTAKSLTDIEADAANGLAAWKPVGVRSLNIVLGSAVAATTFLWFGVARALNTANSADAAFYLDPADFAVAGRTTQLRMRTAFMTDSTAPGVNFTLALQPVATFGTVTNTSAVATLAAAVLSTVKTTPAASSQFHDETSAITFPAAGWYVFTVANSGTTATNSSSFIGFELQHRQV